MIVLAYPWPHHGLLMVLLLKLYSSSANVRLRYQRQRILTRGFEGISQYSKPRRPSYFRRSSWNTARSNATNSHRIWVLRWQHVMPPPKHIPPKFDPQVADKILRLFNWLFHISSDGVVHYTPKLITRRGDPLKYVSTEVLNRRAI